jgi:hypothetical protein
MPIFKWLWKFLLFLAPARRWEQETIEAYVLSSCQGLCWMLYRVSNGKAELLEHVCRRRLKPWENRQALIFRYVSYRTLDNLRFNTGPAIYRYECRVERRPKYGLPPRIKCRLSIVNHIPSGYPLG